MHTLEVAMGERSWISAPLPLRHSELSMLSNSQLPLKLLISNRKLLRSQSHLILRTCKGYLLMLGSSRKLQSYGTNSIRRLKPLPKSSLLRPLNTLAPVMDNSNAKRIRLHSSRADRGNTCTMRLLLPNNRTSLSSSKMQNNRRTMARLLGAVTLIMTV